MSNSSINVLVVDDEIFICELTKEFLEMSKDIKVDIASSVKEAWKALASRKFDAIISDYQMPDEDGIQFLKALRSRGDKLPFILFTGKGREDVVIEALNNGADFYIQKGGDPKAQYTELAYKVRHAVSRRRGEISLEASVDELQRAASRYKALIAASNTGAWEYHMDSGFMWCSPEYFSMLGRDILDYDMSGKRNLEQVWISLLHPDDRERAKSFFDAYLKNPEGVYEQYFRRAHKDGHWVWIWSRGKMLRDDQGKPTGVVVGTHIDISERKRIEETLRETQTRLRLAMDMAKLGHWEYDVATDTFTFDDQFYALLGTNAEMEGGTMMSSSEYATRFLPPDDAPLVGQETEAAISTKDPNFSRRVEHDIIRRDGERRTISVVFRVLKDPSGKTIKTYGANQDITDIKRNEERLRSLVSRYDVILGVIPDIIVEVDNSKRYTWANQEGFKFFGEDIIGKGASYYFEGDQDTYQRVQSLFDGSSEVILLESWQRRRDGEKRLLSWRCRALTDGDGNVTGALSSARDITERRAREQAVHDSEARLHALIHAIPDLIWLKDMDGVYLSCNPMFERFFGAKEKDIVGRTDYDFVDHDLADSFRENDRKAIAAGGPTINEEWITFADDGRRAFLQTIKTPMYDDMGKFIGVLGIGHDITGLKEAENSLRESEEKFRLITENSPDLIMVQDMDLRYTWVLNPQLGMTHADMIGSTDFDILGKEDAERLTAVKREVLISEKETRFFTKLPSLHGDYQYFDGVYKPKFGSGGEIDGIIGYFRDVTEITKVQESLSEVNRKLNLLSSITRHDINNQLMILEGNLAMLRTNHSAPKCDEYLSKAEAAGRKITAMIRFTKEYEGIGVQSAVWQNIAELVNKVSLDTNMGEVRVVNDVPSGVEILADPMIDKVFSNLVDNAVRHGGKVTTIRFSVEVSSGAMSIVCQDDGAGIPADSKASLFVHVSDGDHGFGLFLSREILAITGICIRENSEDGQGARFEMMVPPGRWRAASGKA
jgi:PAS domain S-box-containing protein